MSNDVDQTFSVEFEIFAKVHATGPDKSPIRSCGLRSITREAQPEARARLMEHP